MNVFLKLDGDGHTLRVIHRVIRNVFFSDPF